MDLHPGQFGVTLGHEPANPKPLKKGQTSQGTLFRQPKPTPEHQWAAKGYSPERRNAIAEAIPKVGRSSVWSGTPSDVFPSLAEAGGKVKSQEQRTRHALVDTLARSTAPLEDIQRNTPVVKVAPFGAAGRMSVKYDYKKSTGAVTAVRQGTLKLDPHGHGFGASRAQMEHTALHEFGHHADFEADPQRFIHNYRFAGISPLEGAAEGYAFKHRVARRNEPVAEYSDVRSYKEFENKPSFRTHFEKASGGTSLDEALGKNLGPQFTEPAQRSLFHGPGSVGNYVRTWATPAHVGTIRVGR